MYYLIIYNKANVSIILSCLVNIKESDKKITIIFYSLLIIMKWIEYVVKFFIIFVCLCSNIHQVNSLDNGLLRQPPMVEIFFFFSKNNLYSYNRVG